MYSALHTKADTIQKLQDSRQDTIEAGGLHNCSTSRTLELYTAAPHVFTVPTHKPSPPVASISSSAELGEPRRHTNGSCRWQDTLNTSAPRAQLTWGIVNSFPLPPTTPSLSSGSVTDSEVCRRCTCHQSAASSSASVDYGEQSRGDDEGADCKCA